MNAMYTTYAPWWACISPVEEYEEEAAYVAGLLRAHRHPVRSVLELGSGGGHNAVHLAQTFDLTLTDLSSEMLAVSRRLNPTLRHICADMRVLRLEETFDAVFLHDAVEYMTTREDLHKALHTAALHCAPGGVVIALPDSTSERFEPSTETGGVDRDGSHFGARYLEWSTRDPQNSERVLTEYALMCRDEDGKTQTHIETHVTGLFPRDVWTETLAAQGLVPRVVVEETTEDRTPRLVFLGLKPSE